jgi:hypothetical protein
LIASLRCLLLKRAPPQPVATAWLDCLKLAPRATGKISPPKFTAKRAKLFRRHFARVTLRRLKIEPDAGPGTIHKRAGGASALRSFGSDDLVVRAV